MRLEDIFGAVLGEEAPEVDLVAKINEVVTKLNELTEAHNKLAAVVVELAKRQRGEA